MKISVLISTYNEERNIEACLKSLKNQTYKNFEIVIVDAHSKDNTVKIAKKYTDKIILVEKTLIALQKNKGVNACKGDYVVLSDADCTHPKDWIEKIVKFLGKHPDISVYGGVDVGKKTDPLFERAVFAFDKNDETITDSIKAAWRLRGCNIIYKRKDFLSVGGYDAELSGSEEPELHTRMAKKGFKLYFDKNLVVYHRRRPDLFALFKQMFRNGISSGKIFKKRKDMFLLSDLIGICYFFMTILLAVSLFINSKIALIIFVIWILPNLLYSTKAAFNSKMLHFELFIPILFTKVFAYGFGIVWGYFGGKHIQGIKF